MMRIADQSRRRLLSLAGAVGACALLAAHTPYRQWVIMRRRFLLVLTSREDPGSDALGERIAAVLLSRLPSSRAEVVRGPTDARVASLLSTGQMDVAVVSHSHALALSRGAPPFADFPATPLRVIVENGDYAFVCRDDFPVHHGYLVAQALMADREQLGVTVPDREAGSSAALGHVPTHAGALAFLRGRAPDPS
ncbi:MAG: hypothetical protein GC151_04260 [Betaproteobacteria bacterium]|nr:hypothetical protein [Betaproteobacteria bacterium]